MPKSPLDYRLLKKYLEIKNGKRSFSLQYTNSAKTKTLNFLASMEIRPESSTSFFSHLSPHYQPRKAIFQWLESLLIRS